MEWVDGSLTVTVDWNPYGRAWGGKSAGSYLADPTSPIPSHYAVIILFNQKCPSASIVVTNTLRVNC